MNFSNAPQLRGKLPSVLSKSAALELVEKLLSGFSMAVPDWNKPAIAPVNNAQAENWRLGDFHLTFHYSLEIPDSDDYAYNWAATRTYHYRLTAHPFPGGTGLLLRNDIHTDGFTYYWIFGKKQPARDLKQRILTILS